MWIATNCFNGFNRRNGNLKFVENDGVLGFAAMLQFVCVDWFGLARSSRKATPNSANIVCSSKAIRVHTVRATSWQIACFWSTVHFICRPDVNLEVIPVWGPLVGLADHGRLITHELC